VSGAGSVCPTCGSPIAPEQKFCTVCGSPTTIAPGAKVSTGIRDLDRVLAGGFDAGKTCLVAGETGTGKTIFSLQFLLRGVERKEPGIYATVSERTEKLVADVARFGWDLKPLIDKGMLRLIDLGSLFGAKVWDRPERVVEAVMSELTGTARSTGAKRLVVDPLAPPVTAELPFARQYVHRVITSVESTLQTTNVMTSELATGAHALSRYGAEEHLASGVIILELSRVGDYFVRKMVIRKMSWNPVHPTVYRFEIEGGRGITLKERLGH